jgi:hypothetical protein
MYENALYPAHIVRQGLTRTAFRLREHPRSESVSQTVLTWNVTRQGMRSPLDLIAQLRGRGVAIAEGGHTFYVPPHPAVRELLPEVAMFYPGGAGFKILKDLREPHRARYLFRHRQWLRILQRLIGTPHDQLVAANYMYALGIGPRVWDLTCWRVGDQCCTVFVVDHIVGRLPSSQECDAFLNRLEHLNGSSHLRILIPEWQRHEDFKPPDCHGNLVYSDWLGRTQYVDFQNFGLAGQSAWAREAASTLAPTSASDPETMSHASLTACLRRHAVTPDGRLVVDAACRTGTMVRRLLAAGAAWGVGLCEPDAAAAIEASLLSTGMTRFTLIPRPGDSNVCVTDLLPAHLHGRLENAIVLRHSTDTGRTS